MPFRLLQFLLALAALVGSVLYIEGYLGDWNDTATGTRRCRRAPDEVKAWSGHYTTRRTEHLEDLEAWARSHPDDVNRQFGASCSMPLHEAAQFGREDVARILLARGARVDARAKWGDTPLHRAAWYGHAATVDLLLAHGADVDARDEGGMTPLHEVMSTVREENDLATRITIARALLAAGADPDAPQGSGGRTPLHYAVSAQGHPALVEVLLAGGANPNLGDAPGWTPLHAAAFEGGVATVRRLLDGGAEVNAADRFGTPLATAARMGHVEVARLLLDRGADPEAGGATRLLPWNGTPLAMAMVPPGAPDESSSRRLAIAVLLIERGANVDARDEAGRTILHGAAEEGDLATVRLLLDRQADVNARDRTGATPLHHAVLHARLAVAEILLASGADVGLATASGATPLALAHQDPEMDALLQRQMDR